MDFVAFVPFLDPHVQPAMGALENTPGPILIAVVRAYSPHSHLLDLLLNNPAQSTPTYSASGSINMGCTSPLVHYLCPIHRAQ